MPRKRFIELQVDIDKIARDLDESRDVAVKRELLSRLLELIGRAGYIVPARSSK